VLPPGTANKNLPVKRTKVSPLQGLGESLVPASSTVVSIVFLVYLCLVFRMVDIYMPVVECGMFHSLQMCFLFIPVFYYFFA
jgi:hypothetical protein